jgi:GGDEF domain-containing protein
MHAEAIGFVWGAYFGTVALMLAGALAAFVQSHHRVALAAALTALLSALFISSYLVGLPVSDPDLEVRLVALVGLFSATMLQMMLLVDLGVLRDRERRRRVLTGVAAVAVLTVGVSWMVTPRQALMLCSSLSFGVSVAATLSALRSAWRGDRLAWAAVSGALLLPVCVGGVSWIALDPRGVPWLVHAASALAGMMFLTGIGAMLWLRYSYLIELREVLAQGPRYDPITRMQSNGATGHMIAQAFLRQQQTPVRPLILIGVSIGNLYALENLHGRAALNHALFVCASRLRRCVPADIEMGRLFDDGFLLISRNAKNVDSFVKLGREVAQRLSRPVMLRTSSGEEAEGQTAWAAQVGVGLLATTAHANPAAEVAKVRDMSRTAWSFASRMAWHDRDSDVLAELPTLEPVH